MVKEGEMLGLDEQEGEEPDAEEKEIVDENIIRQSTPEPPRTPSPSPSQSGTASELATRDPSPEHDPTKTNHRSRKPGKKVLLEPMAKTEKRTLRQNQQLGEEPEQEAVNGHKLLMEEEAEEPTQTSELSKRDKRRAKQAKKADSTTALAKVCSFLALSS